MFESTTSHCNSIELLEVLDTLCRTAALIAAASLFERLPGVLLLEGGLRGAGFFVRFIPPYDPPPEMPRLIEEGMRQVLKENRPFRVVEMTAFSAREMFRKLGREREVVALEEMPPSSLVSVIQIGDFWDLAEGPFCSNLASVGAFQVSPFRSIGDGVFELEGCAASSKEELKALVRKRKQYEAANYHVLGLREGLWEGEGRAFLWLEKGLQKREVVLKSLKELLCKEALQVASSSRESIDQYGWRKKGALWSVREGDSPPGFQPENPTLFFRWDYFEEKKFPLALTSCLQLMHQTLIILGFHPSLCLGGQTKGIGKKSIESVVRLAASSWQPHLTDDLFHGWKVKDGLGRLHYAVEFEMEPQGPGIVVEMRIEIEKILALLLEGTFDSKGNH